MLDLQGNREISGPVKNAIGLFIISAVAIAFFSPMLFDGKVIFYRDFQFITYPLRYFLAQAYHQGVIPYWTTNTFGGMPFMATLHPGVFYPPSILFFLNDFNLALNLYYVLHFLILGWFAFLLGRQWNLSWFAALCCGVTGMLGGLVIASTLISNYFLAEVWLPLIFWLYYKFAEKNHVGYFIGLVLAIAMQTLAACPEISVMTMVLLYLHAVVFMPRAQGKSGYVRITATLGLAVVLALGITAFQLAPTAQLLQHTFRGGGLDFNFHALWSLEPSKLTTFILSPGYKEYLDVPVTKDNANIFSGLLNTLYMGIFGFVFVILGFLFRKDKAVGFWLAVFFLGIFFALGKYNPIYESIYNWTPFLNSFRYPEKYFFASTFAAIFLVGFVLDALVRTTRSRQIKVFTVVTLLIGIIGATSVLAWSNPNLEPQLPLAFLFVFSVTYVLFYFNKIKRQGFTALVFVMILMDLSIKGFHLLPLIDPGFYKEKPMLMDILGGSAGKYRTYSGHVEKTPNPMAYPNGPTRLASMRAGKQHVYPFLGMIYGVEHVGGVPGLAMDIQNHMVWYQYLIHTDPDRRLRILKRTNVKYWIDGDTITMHTPDGYPVIFPDRVKILEDALPRAFLVPKMRVMERNEILHTYYDASFDPLQEVILREPVDFRPSENFKGQVRDVAYRLNHVTVKTSQEGNGFLVLLDTFLPGWTVQVDGREQPILNANGLYRAVQLAPGEHTLEFDYFPEGFRAGLIVSAVFLLMLIALPMCRPLKRFLLQPVSPSVPDPEPAESPDSDPTIDK